jgi:hypothetical protein
VTFKRRIGTKGARPERRRGFGLNRSAEVIVTSSGIVAVLKALSSDHPLVWELIGRAIDRRGGVRLDFAPAAAELNLAEAQVRARARLIEHTIDQLRALRPSL